MLIFLAGNAEDHLCFISIKIYTAGYVYQGQTAFDDGCFTFIRAVRYRETVAHESGNNFLTCEHGIDIGRFNSSLIDKELAGLSDDIFLGFCRLVQYDIM